MHKNTARIIKTNNCRDLRKKWRKKDTAMYWPVAFNALQQIQAAQEKAQRSNWDNNTWSRKSQHQKNDEGNKWRRFAAIFFLKSFYYIDGTIRIARKQDNETKNKTNILGVWNNKTAIVRRVQTISQIKISGWNRPDLSKQRKGRKVMW